MARKNKFNNYYNSLESSEETKKYLKEMYDMSDKNSRNVNVIFAAFGIPLCIIFTLTILQMFSFSVNLVQASTKSSEVEIVSTINTDSTKTASSDEKEVTSSTGNASNNESVDIQLNLKLTTYLKENENRKTSLDKATALNDGSDKGLATMFIAQILRDNNYAIPEKVINTQALVSHLEKDGWEKITDFNKLQEGDICFTSKSKSGAPSHTYIFMGWVTEGKTDYGYIVDNQLAEYKDTYHKRNISVATPKKDKFDFFMRKK